MHDDNNTDSTPRYPKIEVELLGQDGNAFSILGAVSSALRKAGKADQVEAFMDEATSGDYDHLLATCGRWVTIY